MKALLDNRYAPITFHCGFLECPFESFAETFASWHKQIENSTGSHTEMDLFSATLPEALSHLQPLRTPTDRHLCIETRSGWSAVFANGLRVNDVSAPVGHLPTLLNCRGLAVACVPDRSDKAGKDGLQIYGSIAFTLYGPEKTDWLNRIRHISLANDAGNRWAFDAAGEVQPFERPENYGSKKVTSRFTPEMLETYCKALGIDLFFSDFYGGRCLLARNTSMRAPGPTMSIAEARKHLYL
jgi:hypothetical protein